MQEQAYRAWLKLQPIGAKTVIDQISRARRLERAFGDLDMMFAHDEMSGLIKKSLGKSAVLPKSLHAAGMLADTRNTLRQAARTYLKFKQETSIPDLPIGLQPRKQPKAISTKRKLQPTGFWQFSASPGKWDANGWSQSGTTELLYYVNDDDRELIQVGDLGFLKRNVWRYVPAEILAIFEVIEAARVRDEPDPRISATRPQEGSQTGE